MSLSCKRSYLQVLGCLLQKPELLNDSRYNLDRDDFDEIFSVYPELKDVFHNFIFQRFRNYAQLFLSRITDSPKERYDDLLKNQPEIIKRIPQHYIASFLGVTPVSLSRIRNKK